MASTAEEEREEGEEGETQTGAPRPRSTSCVNMSYCTVCGGPFEYCAWDTRFNECKAAFKEANAEAFPDEAALLAEMERLGLEGNGSGKKKKGGGGASEEGDSGGKKGKKKASATVLVELTNRNKRKFVTTVKGLEAFAVDPSAAAKDFGKKFASGAAFQKGKNGLPDQIEIQGNCRDELPAFIHKKFPHVALSSIFIVGDDGKKTAAGEELVD